VEETAAKNREARPAMMYTVTNIGHKPGDVRWAEVPFPRAIIDEM